MHLLKEISVHDFFLVTILSNVNSWCDLIPVSPIPPNGNVSIISSKIKWKCFNDIPSKDIGHKLLLELPNKHERQLQFLQPK